ncbi:MAG TPA: glycerophosphodiester phosphodiesterase family protein [Candidatus Paceibacterota bacterium]
MNKLLKIGHRGACGYEPENTLRSFRKALELGVDMVELDVYVLNAGNCMVIHDDTVDRTTNGKGYVWEKTFEELRELDAGKGEKIPTLQEVFDLVDRKAQVNVELKGVNTAEPVARLIEQYVAEKGWSYDDFLVSSFNHVELKKFHDTLPQVRIGSLITAIPITYAQFGEELGAYSVNLNKEFISREFVEDAHKRGMKVFVFTVNEPDEIEQMRSLGVDGVFTNYPDRF